MLSCEGPLCNLYNTRVLSEMFSILIILLLLLWYFWLKPFGLRTDDNVPEPRGLPVLGHLLSLGKSPALTYYKWGRECNSELIKIRLGVQRFYVTNSYAAAVELIHKNMSANCDRPQPHTFSKVISSTGLTVGTTPYGPSYKRMRKAIGGFLCRRGVDASVRFIDKESHLTLRSLPTGDDFQPHEWFKAYPFNVSMQMAYGRRIKDMRVVYRILGVEQEITKYRAHWATNMVDYFPLLRYFLPQPHKAAECRIEREDYLHALINTPKDEQDKACLVAAARRGELKLESYKELKSICMTMTSAGLDSIPGVLALFLGHMSTAYGQRIQTLVYEELLAEFSCNAYEEVVHAKQADYLSAVVTETLRFSGMPLGLPRKTTKPIHFVSRGSSMTIPASSTILLNIFAANFDEKQYIDPFVFSPERHLNSSTKEGPAHFSFGAGSRICAGITLANRELYVMIARLILLYRILPSRRLEDRMPTSPFQIYKQQSALMFDIPEFKIRLERRI